MRTKYQASWRVIYIAHGEQQAQRVEDALRQGGFFVEERPPAADDARHEDIEIRALGSEAEEARLYLMEQGL